MFRRNLIIILGAWLILVSLSGLPEVWKTWLISTTGVVLLVLALVRLIFRDIVSGASRSNTFAQSVPIVTKPSHRADK